MWFISKFLLRIFGWKVHGTVPDLKKAVGIVAPHTSIYDFVIGGLFFVSLRKKAGFLIKSSYFFFPLGIILKAFGGIPVDSKSKTNMINKSVEIIRQRDNIFLVITPEGTRSATKHWKRGFYYISLKAGIPIIHGYLDYKYKIIGIGPVIWPSGDIDADMLKIKKYYLGINARHPERFTTGLEGENEKR
ncbi:MAG: 1-acyl-sn-glycerol-3-phosphate acyltransferase [Bacteroidia bacterium]|nr:1-acyl-sn-glycerol-3-phosphate acyltransferase [Bacteroidia bacterium]